MILLEPGKFGESPSEIQDTVIHYTPEAVGWKDKGRANQYTVIVSCYCIRASNLEVPTRALILTVLRLVCIGVRF